ncbi:MAG: hypothetical protein WCY56_03110 [Aminobacteriaceae bacterium]
MNQIQVVECDPFYSLEHVGRWQDVPLVVKSTAARQIIQRPPQAFFEKDGMAATLLFAHEIRHAIDHDKDYIELREVGGDTVISRRSAKVSDLAEWLGRHGFLLNGMVVAVLPLCELEAIED